MRVAADVGGTFTDIVVDDGAGRLHAHKLPSTPWAFDEGVLLGSSAAVEALGAQLAEVVDFRHGTTVATNAVLERTGPATALVTTAGFRDVLEIGRLRTPNLYDLGWRKPVPLVPRRHRLEVTERMGPDGRAVLSPALDELRPRLAQALSEGVVTVAVSLLNAYADPRHEELVADWIHREFPGLDVTVGTQVVREIGEYERTSTAVVNAYLRPVVSGYLDRLEQRLGQNGCTAPVLVMQSSGGMTPVVDAARFPAQILESGPASGVLAAASIARSAEVARAISFDMGGTTAKASLVENYQVTFATEFSVGSAVSAASQLLRGGGYTVRLPVVDLAEVGAGGGSIARVDPAGGLHVGPQSAGADPGPACYGRGGALPTVTDANLILGYINPTGLRAAGVDLDPDQAQAVLSKHVARPLGITVAEAALAVHAVADRQMARALRAVTTERGREVGDHTLVAFGGSGPLHAATLAESVGIRTVIIPPLAGVLSAVGLLTAPLEISLSQTLAIPLEPEHRGRLCDGLAAGRAAALDRFRTAGLSTDGVQVDQVVDVRYQGQAFELPLVVTARPDSAEIAALTQDFHDLHKSTYGHDMHLTVEVVRARTTVSRPGSRLPGQPTTLPSEHSSRSAAFSGVIQQVPVVNRTDLTGVDDGPLLVDDTETTTVVPPGWTVRVDEHANLRLERRS